MRSEICPAHLAGISFSGVPNPRRLPSPRRVSSNRQLAMCEPVAAKPAFISWLLEQVGLDVRHYRGRPLERRVNACLRILHVKTEEDARARLHEEPELMHSAVDTVLIGVTRLFRDPGVLQALGRRLADLGTARPLRVWSVGCSDGAELYSVAMLLADLSLLKYSELVGTDCREAAIRAATVGTYGLECLELVPSAMRDCYFERRAEGVRVRDSLRHVVRWQIHDFLGGPLPGPWDVILWRNSAIYLEPDSASKVATDLTRELRPGGLLVVGRAERIEGQPVLSRIDRCIYRKSGE